MVEDLEKTIKEKKNRKSFLSKEIEELQIEFDRVQDELFEKEDEEISLEEDIVNLEEELKDFILYNKIKGKILKVKKYDSYLIPIETTLDNDFSYIVTLNIYESEFSDNLMNFTIEEYDLRFLIKDCEEVSKFDNNIEKCVRRVINIAKKGLLTENRKRKFKKLKNEIDK